MCGIVGYTGKQKALPILFDGIKNLEYRGYDSAGFAVVAQDGSVVSQKAIGRVANLEARAGNAEAFAGTTGIVHSRWATHGGVTEANAHPHSDCGGNIWLVHNGIIENYRELKKGLEEAGHRFTSETDTEVVAHLIEEARQETGDKRQETSLEDATRKALQKIRGTYGLAIVSRNDPEKLIAARNFSPLLIGIGTNEYIVASDASAVLRYTRDVMYLDDGEMAVLTPAGHRIFDMENNAIEKKRDTIEWELEQAQKGGHPHFMFKEILEQPEAIENSLRGRLIAKDGIAKLGGLESVAAELRGMRRLFVAACGTAYYAGKVGEYMLEEYAGIPVEVDIASEFRYRKPVFEEGDVLLAVSQSGETADTLAAIKEAKQKGLLALGIVNVVGSSIARATDAGVYQHIGPEIGVASTKAFTSQVAILALWSLLLGRSRDMSYVMGKRIAEELKQIPNLARRVLEDTEKIAELAKKYQPHQNFMFLGRKYNYPVALEGALKLKEISYVHAEGYSAGEMKHGPIAMIDENFPSIIIAPQDSVYEKMLSNIQEIRARKGPVIAIATEGDEEIGRMVDDVIYIPKTLEMLTPMLSVIPLQLFAYYFAVLRGCDVDKPRNLAKSVTVE